MIVTVENVLRTAGRPLTYAEVCEAAPRRSSHGISRALRAAVEMGHVKRTGRFPDDTYEYLTRENRDGHS